MHYRRLAVLVLAAAGVALSASGCKSASKTPDEDEAHSEHPQGEHPEHPKGEHPEHPKGEHPK